MKQHAVFCGIFFCILGFLSQITEARVGICSWYGSEYPQGSPTACNGQGFNRFALTASTWPEVPCGSQIRVTNLSNGRSVIVTVNDRFGPGNDAARIVDLSSGSFSQIANLDDGLIYRCQYEIL